MMSVFDIIKNVIFNLIQLCELNKKKIILTNVHFMRFTGRKIKLS